MNKDDDQQAATVNGKICHKKEQRNQFSIQKASISYSLQLLWHKN